MIITQMMPMAKRIINITITGNVTDFNPYAYRNAGGTNITTNPTGAYLTGAEATIIVTVNSGVIVGSTSITGSFIVDTQWNTNDKIVISNYGKILGKGGAANSGVGGVAFSTTRAVTLNNNLSGYIGGGGGGGGRGAQWYGRTFDGETYSAYQYGGGGGGGGGRGYVGGTGGAINGGSTGAGAPVQPTAGGSGSDTGNGNAGSGGVGYNAYSGGYEIYGGNGGAGGTLGQSGYTGQNGYVANASIVNGGNGAQSVAMAGGAGGAAIVGNSFITWVDGVNGPYYGIIS